MNDVIESLERVRLLGGITLPRYVLVECSNCLQYMAIEYLLIGYCSRCGSLNFNLFSN